MQISRTLRKVGQDLGKGLVLCMTFSLGMTASVFAQVNLTTSNLPIMVVQTLNGLEIPDEPKTTATLSLMDYGPLQRNDIQLPFNVYDGLIGIERRGSTSQGFPKSGYGFETRNADGSNNNVSLLGMPEENDWVLHGPFSDKSLMRNALAYALAGQIMEWAPRTRFVELVINNEYFGVYLLMERLKRDDNRVNIKKLTTDDNANVELTGGYILKIDKNTGNGGDNFASTFRAESPDQQEIFLLFHEPTSESITPQQKSYVQNSIFEMELSLIQPFQAGDSIQGYQQHLDMQSFIDFLIINEISRNIDGYRLSTYLYKDRDEDNGIKAKWKMGPVWDFNLGFGNCDYCLAGETTGWSYNFNNVCPGDFWAVPFWWRKLLLDPYFKKSLNARWQSLRSTTFSNDRLNSMIDSMATELQEAQGRNFTQFPILSEYVWPNNFIGGSYSSEVSYLKNWVTDRAIWMDGQLKDSNTNTLNPLNPRLTPMVYPNPSGTGDFSIVYRKVNPAQLEVDFYHPTGQYAGSLSGNKAIVEEHIYHWYKTDIKPGPYFYAIKVQGEIIGRGQWWRW